MASYRISQGGQKMVLDMTPILSGAVDSLAFEFSFIPAPDGLLASVRADVGFPEPVTVKGLVKNMAGYMCLSASAEVTYTTACARCAESVCSKLEIAFEKDIASDEVSRENDDYLFPEDEKLDLIPPVEEEIMLEMPSRTLCREDCLGLCPKCGKNLNEGSCGCAQHEPDPRLAVLKTLLK